MVNIEKLKPEIVERLKPLKPDKIILFGSYANGTATEDSDIDLFLVKNIKKDDVGDYRLKARKYLRNVIYENHLGIDIFADSQKRIKERIEKVKDQFYQEIFDKGVIWYGE